MSLSLKALMLTSCAAIGSACFSMPAMAQDEGAEAGSRKLDTITVTARKTEENLQDVPISVTAVSGDILDDNGITTFQSLAERTPNLRVQVTEGGPATIVGIRGIASGFNRGFEQSVGVVVDGVYNARGEFFRTGIIDVERVEVLRGPQGTLFGKNATAGLINVITAGPTDTFEASLKTRIGSDELYGATAVVSGPLTEGVTARLMYNHLQQDSYIENTGGGIDGGAFEDNNVRLKVLAEPTDNLDVLFTYERLERNVEGTAQEVFLLDDSPNAGFFGFNPAANPYDPGNGGAGFIPIFGVSSQEYFLTPDPNADFVLNHTQSSDIDSYFDTLSENFRVEANWDVAGHTVTYVGGLIDLTDNNVFDPDFSANPYLVGPAEVESEQITHELRVQSPDDQRLTWTAGLYKFDLEYENSPAAFLNVPNVVGLLPPVAPGVPPLPNADFASYQNGVFRTGERLTLFEQETDAWAAFAQATFDITDRFRITVGGRYTDETKTSNQAITNDNGALITPAGSVGVPAIPGVTFVDTNGNFMLDAGETVQTPAEYANSFDTTVGPYCFSDVEVPFYDAAGLGDPCGPALERDESKFTPMVNLQYDFTDTINGYFAWSEGFKGGGFNGQARRAESLEFEEETVEAFEVGVKSVLLDGAMTANVAVYHSIYEDFQTTQFVNQVFIVGNAGEVKSQGVEAELLWQATDNLRVGFSGAYSDATYEDFDNAACTSLQQMALSPFAPPPNPSPRSLCRQDQAGKRVELSPEYSGNLSFLYDLPLADMPFDAQFGTDIAFTDDFFLTQDLDPLIKQDAYSTVNLRAAIIDKNDRWELAFLGQNVTDEVYLVSAAGVPAQNGAFFASSNRGAVYEVQFNLNF